MLGMVLVFFMVVAAIGSFVVLFAVKKSYNDPQEKDTLRIRIGVLGGLLIAMALFFYFVYFSFFMAVLGIVSLFFDVKYCIGLLRMNSEQPYQSGDSHNQLHYDYSQRAYSDPEPQSQSRPEPQPQPRPEPQSQSRPGPQPQPQNQAQFCPHCGAEVRPGCYFCENCGNKL